MKLTQSDGNILFFGDNLHILRDHVSSESIDLVYLDPPFNSKANYNILFSEPNGAMSDAQIVAFEDTWHWTPETSRMFEEIIEIAPAPVVEMIRAFRQFIGLNDVMAYLTMMCIRLLELRRVLRDTGTIYLHCDPTASHYLKLLMDAVFGFNNFRNEIIWAYRGGGSGNKDFGCRHDVILRYSKTNNYNFYPDPVRIPYQAEGIGRTDDAMWGKHRGTDKVYKPHPLGKIPEDWWPINILNANDPERLGYPTQKPEILLERIIKASSEEGNVVLDPFCGCGTTISVAERLKRRWIGIDITHLAIRTIKERLNEAFQIKQGINYIVQGEPEDFAGAVELANQNRYQFQLWVLSLLPNSKPGPKGADGGIDGFLFIQEIRDEFLLIVVQVKSGSVSVRDIRELGDVVTSKKGVAGILVTLEEPTRNMKIEAASKGFYSSKVYDSKHPTIQILTVKELLSGVQADIPPTLLVRKKARTPIGSQPAISFPPKRR